MNDYSLPAGEKRYCYDVSVIIVTYNSAAFIQDCLQALASQTMTSFETIIVDNGSTDHTLDAVKPWLDRGKVIKLGENRGFAGGNIAGLSQAQGRYIALLNPDTVVSEDWLKSLVDTMENHPDYREYLPNKG